MNAIFYNSEFATPERATEEELKESIEFIKGLKNLKPVTDAIPHLIFILNEYRQIVFINKAVLQFLNVSENELYGKRPGEVVGCIHAKDFEKGGCGCTAFCKYCGAVHAIIDAFSKGTDVEECSIMLETGDTLNLRVSGSTIAFGGKQFCIFCAMDISEEKQKQMLERLFFHDIVNTAGVIQGTLEMLPPYLLPDGEKFFFLLKQEIQQLIDEIYSQKQLVAAQNGTLEPNIEPIMSDEILRNLINTFNFLSNNFDKQAKIRISENPGSVELFTDSIILKRVLMNVIKNALEASKPDETVDADIKIKGNNVEFIIKNRAYIPEEIQKQMFLMKISTKGPRRGIGTFSIRLLTEKYLRGKVSFTSTEEKGTEFIISLPIEKPKKILDS